MAQVGQYQIGSFASPVNGGPLDATVVRGNDNAIVGVHDNHDNDPTIHVQSFPFASLPSASTLGRFLIASDTQRAYFDTGSVLQELAYLSKAGGAITGNLTISGTLAGTGIATFSSDVIAARIQMSTGASQIIPGVTSFSIRNHANGADNLIVLDNGNGTFRGSVSVLGDTLKYLSGGATTLTVGNDVSAGVVTIRTEGANRISVSTATTAISNAVTMASTVSVTGQATFGAAQFTGAANSVVIGSQTLGSSLTPGTNNTFDLGAGSFQWRDLWLARNASILGTLDAGATTLAGILLPDTTATYDIGATATRWRSLFLSAGAVIGGSVSVGTTGTFGGNVLPGTTASFDLGVTGTRWRNLFLSADATIGGAAAIGTTLLVQGLSTLNTLSVTGLSTLNKIKGSGGTPTLTVISGTGGSLTVTGTDMAGQASFQSSINGSVILRLTFAVPYATAPFVQLTPVNSAAGQSVPLPISPTTAQVDIAFALAVSNGVQYIFNYSVIA